MAACCSIELLRLLTQVLQRKSLVLSAPDVITRVFSRLIMETESARRPLKTRQAAWANRLAQLLVRWHASPNVISVTSIFFALGAGAALYFAAEFSAGEHTLLLVLAMAGIQGRLLCNMLDGMVAIEGGRKTKSG